VFAALGHWVFRWRWAIIGVWVVLLATALPLAPRAGAALKGGFGEVDTEARRALRLLERDLGLTPTVHTLVYHSDRLTVDDPAFRQEAQDSLQRLAALPAFHHLVTYLNSPNPYLVSGDRHTTYALLWMELSGDEGLERVGEVRQALRTPTLQTWVTGPAAIFADLNAVSEQDLRRAEIISFPLVMIALLVVFGTAVAASLPLIMGAVSLVVTLAILYLVSQVTEMSVFSLNMASLLGLGVAIDYSLLLVSRFREELARGQTEEALVRTLTTAGRALLFAGLTTVLGLLGLLLFRFMMLRSIGIGGVVVVGLSVLVALTLLPAILGVLGPRVNALPVLPRRRLAQGFWERWARAVMRHPLLVLLPAIAFLVLLGLPFRQVRVGTPWASVLPSGAEARQGWDLLARQFGEGELSPVVVAVTSPTAVLRPENVAALYGYTQELAQDPRVQRVESIVTLDPRLTLEAYQALYRDPEQVPLPQVQAVVKELASQRTTMVRVISPHLANSEEAKALVRELRRKPIGGDLQTQVTGSAATLIDVVAVLYHDFPYALAFVVGSIYLVLLVLFRSVVLPAKAVLMNTLSILASYGALVFIFQQGHFQGLLGFQAEGYLEATIPILLFCILFGLSMDYEVFLLSRVKEIYDVSGDNSASVAQGLERTAGIITSAALIIVLVSAAFATGEVIVVKSLGVGIALAIFVDATVVRALLVPSLMRLLGDWNWWAPRFIKRLLPGFPPGH